MRQGGLLRFGAGLGVVFSLVGAAGAQRGAVYPIHDPAIIERRVGSPRYLIISTGPGIRLNGSDDLLNWEARGRIFTEDTPTWAKTVARDPRTGNIPRDIWAPDISAAKGEYRLYYAVSTFGSQFSAIGLATNRTLDPADPRHQWRDKGPIIVSSDKTPYNAIDPNLAYDARRNPYLVFGSFFQGLYILPIDDATGKPKANATPTLVARRPNTNGNPVEAAFIVYRNGFYYLFVSFDQCCSGVNSTYKTMVGRSRFITGPYRDKTGRDMREGGGSLVIAGYGDLYGPGHEAVLMRPQTLSPQGQKVEAILVHHAYFDPEDGGASVVQIRPLEWTDGFPVAGGPLRPGPVVPDASLPALLTGHVWTHAPDLASSDMRLLPGGKINDANGPNEWMLVGRRLTLRWPDKNAPGGAWRDVVTIAPDGRSFVGQNQNGTLIRGEMQLTDAELRQSLLTNRWRHTVGAPQILRFLPDGRIEGTAGTWALSGRKLTLRWPDKNAPGGAWTDAVTFSFDGDRYVGANQDGTRIRGFIQ